MFNGVRVYIKEFKAFLKLLKNFFGHFKLTDKFINLLFYAGLQMAKIFKLFQSFDEFIQSEICFFQKRSSKNFDSFDFLTFFIVISHAFAANESGCSQIKTLLFFWYFLCRLFKKIFEKITSSHLSGLV